MGVIASDLDAITAVATAHIIGLTEMPDELILPWGVF